MMKSRMRSLAAVVGACALAAGVLTISAPAASASTGTLKLDPTSGTGADPVTVVTSGGCNSSSATHFVVILTGSGVKYDPKYKGFPGQPELGPGEESVNFMVGSTALSAISSSGSSTNAMRAPLAKIFNTVRAENKGGRLSSGVYNLRFECRTKTGTDALATFSTAITITESGSSLTFEEGAKPTAVVNKAKPKITGKGRVGATLRVSTGTWEPKPDRTTVQWRIGKKTIGTGATYKVKKGDRGKTITAVVTATKAGLTPGTASAKIKIAK